MSVSSKEIHLAHQFPVPLQSSSHRYQETPWGTIAPEVMLHIFSFIVADEPPFRWHSTVSGSESPQSAYPPLGWIRLGHVQSSWRRVLLNNAVFWAGSVGIYSRAMREMLERAGSSTLLRVHLPYSHGIPPESGLQELLDAYKDDRVALLRRLHTLIIENDVTPSGPQVEQAGGLFCSPLPELQVLKLSFNRFSEAGPGRLSMDLEAQKLRETHLVNCCFTGAWFVPALVSLRIVLRYRPVREWIASPRYIIDVLEACKLTIQHVYLRNVFCDDRLASDQVDARVNALTAVRLSHLVDLYLEDFAAEAAALLSGLTYPSTAHVRIPVTKCRRSSNEVAVFRELVRAALGEHAGRFNALRMHDDDHDPSSPEEDFNIDLYELPPEDEHRCAWFAGLRPAVSFHIECDGSPYHIYSYIRDFFTEDIFVPVLSERVPHIQKLAFALGDVHPFNDEVQPERHIRHIIDYASDATTVAVEDPYAYGCPVMDAFCEQGRLPCVDTLCVFARSREGGKAVECAGLKHDLPKRASTIPVVHIDRAQGNERVLT